MFTTEYVGLIPILDILVTFFRAYYLPNGTMIYDPQAIRLHYTSDRLLLDLVSFFPFDVVLALFAAAHHPFAGFIRIPRMLSLYSVWYKRGYTFDLGANPSMALAIGRLLIITALITHLFACVWWYIGSFHMLTVRFLTFCCRYYR